MIAPDAADAYEGRVLEAQVARALRRTSFSMWEDEHGVCHGRFAVPHLSGQMLGKALFALDAAEDTDEPVDVRRGVAVTRLLEALTAKDLPTTGGAGATVVVTLTLDPEFRRRT